MKELERCEVRDLGKRREIGGVEREVREIELGVDALLERDIERKRRSRLGVGSYLEDVEINSE